MQVGTELQLNCVALFGLDSEVPGVAAQLGVGGETVQTPVVALNVPIEQSGVSLQVKMFVPAILDITVPAGHDGVGAVTVQVPVDDA